MKKLTGVILHNTSTNVFTAFIKEYPGVLAQGKSEDEVKNKLDKNWDNFLDYMIKKENNIEYELMEDA